MKHTSSDVFWLRNLALKALLAGFGQVVLVKAWSAQNWPYKRWRIKSTSSQFLLYLLLLISPLLYLQGGGYRLNKVLLLKDKFCPYILWKRSVEAVQHEEYTNCPIYLANGPVSASRL